MAPDRSPKTTAYVAPPPLGDDATDGTDDRPVATLGRALALGRPLICVAGGTYGGAIALGGAVTIVGGLDPAAGWQRGATPSVLTGGRANRALTVLAGARVRLEDLHVAPGDHARLGVVIDQGATATILRCVLVGGTEPGGQPAAVSCWGEIHLEACHVDGGPASAAAETTAISAFGRATIVDNDVVASHIGVNCSGATVERNRIRAGTYGVYIQGDDVTVRGNAITLAPRAPGARGVFVVSGERLIIEGNTIDGRPDHEQLARWAHLPVRSWSYDESGRYAHSEVTITANGLWFHGEAEGPSGGPYTGPTQDLDDLLVNDPVQPLPPELLAEIRAFLRAHLPPIRT